MQIIILFILCVGMGFMLGSIKTSGIQSDSLKKNLLSFGMHQQLIKYGFHTGYSS
jgi:hypothetical protein